MIVVLIENNQRKCFDFLLFVHENHVSRIFRSVVVIVFRPGLVQGSGSRFWPGHQVARVNSFFFLNQNNVILVKKKNKNQQVATWFFTESARSHQFFPSLIFSSTRPGSSTGSTRRAGLGFKTMVVAVIFQSFFI